WRAALVLGEDLRIWDMGADGALGPPRSLPAPDLSRLPGPVIAAGLDIAPRPVPCPPLAPTTHVPGVPGVAAIPPLSQADPAALSRGAEVALAGYLALHPRWDGVILVCGPETLWAHCSAGEVVSFVTFLTPQLCAALGVGSTPGEAFDAALSQTLSRPEALARHLASARAAGTGQEAAHLIGAEIAAAKPYWLGQDVVILGDDTGAYAAALAAQGVAARAGDLDRARLRGFGLVWDDLTQPPSSR
ncbi:MAG: 2-keto-3-deoxy-galactonokinase, partial [Rhodobacteraceae bacterium]